MKISSRGFSTPRGHLLTILLLSGLGGFTVADTMAPPKDSLAWADSLGAKSNLAWEGERTLANREDYRLLRRVDSVGWLKVQALRKAGQSMLQLEREQTQRKLAALISFCSEERFQKLAEADSIPEMTADEREFCKNRLKLVNPILP